MLLVQTIDECRRNCSRRKGESPQDSGTPKANGREVGLEERNGGSTYALIRISMTCLSCISVDGNSKR